MKVMKNVRFFDEGDGETFLVAHNLTYIQIEDKIEEIEEMTGSYVLWEELGE